MGARSWIPTWRITGKAEKTSQEKRSLLLLLSGEKETSFGTILDFTRQENLRLTFLKLHNGCNIRPELTQPHWIATTLIVYSQRMQRWQRNQATIGRNRIGCTKDIEKRQTKNARGANWCYEGECKRSSMWVEDHDGQPSAEVVTLGWWR